MSSPTRPSGVFIDAITGRHLASDPQQLLQRRCLTWDKNYGWTYDVWVDGIGKSALSGANSRFSLPAIAKRIADMLQEGQQTAARQLQLFVTHHRQQRRQQLPQHP